MKEELLTYIENQTAFLDLDVLDELFTAKKLAEVFGVKRNTISHYLNQLNDEEKLIKINSRPVYYFHKAAFDQQFFPLKYTNYQSTNEIKEEQPLFEQEKDLFSLLIGHNQSLNRSIEQVKAALFYPDGGLPALITGDSGTGKSFLVRLIYQYCLENELIKDDAPFVTINCAQYANNPELLTSNLFGHVKGAFTGAQEDKKGAFEAANNGILFLDEVHRLNAEGQEKLFTFLDQGIIYRMGETNHSIPINARIFFATTESLESSFLTTFIRRIPIQIELPSLMERSRMERLELVYSFLLAEYNKIRRPLKVTGQVLTLLTNAEFKGNIGELKSSIKVTIANAFSEQKQNERIKITIYHLPETILNASSASIQSFIQKDVLLDEHVTMEQLTRRNQPQQQRVLTSFERMLTEFQQNDEHLENCEDQLKVEVDRLFDFLLFETDRQKKHETLIYLTQYIRDTFKQMEASYQIRFDGNSVYAISYYLFQRGNSRWLPEDQQINQLINSSFAHQIWEISLDITGQSIHPVLELTCNKIL
ncbi:sigma-54-dependent transcriptional regulator [Tetragenococcus koreensis]|nr:sigma-54-dependent transcriptional regulator [Tetragenococcus koreensis]